MKLMLVSAGSRMLSSLQASINAGRTRGRSSVLWNVAKSPRLVAAAQRTRLSACFKNLRHSSWCVQYDWYSRGESPPWPVMTGTIRLGKGARREAGSEESRRRNRGCDVQEADRGLCSLGHPARDGEAR